MKPQKRSNGKKFPRGHVTACSRALGVSQGHLWLVLHGVRQSKRLMDRYSALTKNQEPRTKKP